MSARRMLSQVEGYLREHYGPGDTVPAGLRLEMHPNVALEILNQGSEGIESNITALYGVPTKATIDLAPGKWRLVTVTEEVHLSGTA